MYVIRSKKSPAVIAANLESIRLSSEAIIILVQSMSISEIPDCVSRLELILRNAQSNLFFIESLGSDIQAVIKE